MGSCQGETVWASTAVLIIGLSIGYYFRRWPPCDCNLRASALHSARPVEGVGAGEERWRIATAVC